MTKPHVTLVVAASTVLILTSSWALIVTSDTLDAVSHAAELTRTTNSLPIAPSPSETP